ncbi:hypothetical protein HU230_0041915 (plasmid) [Bradyrhizobium quebecense]|uniref:Uncharacterized protein n=1 Tax=Bradyrhizobium quebecense TaxID=2748629 RepID=A0A973WZF2_9BRAD|nr:hypothetical protein [Bradyrhizobium quebecense]UGA48830.1 hypothetical protein HU230_0041915 [Bradyrhizobium quebecense]
MSNLGVQLLDLAFARFLALAPDTRIKGPRRLVQQLLLPGIAWLSKEGNRTVVVDLDRKVTREATPEELETGVFFASYDDYAASNGIRTERTAA